MLKKKGETGAKPSPQPSPAKKQQRPRIVAKKTSSPANKVSNLDSKDKTPVKRARIGNINVFYCLILFFNLILNIISLIYFILFVVLMIF